MRLYEQMYEDMELLRPIRTPDGEGGSIVTLTRIKPVMAAVVTTVATNRAEADRAEAHAAYKLTAPKGTGLKFGDILRRSDGQLLKVTGDAVSTPALASFEFEKATAEQWRSDF